MREAFEAWAQRDGHITRRREDKPEEYLVFETQRRWVIWQAALAHGKAAAAKPAQKATAKDAARTDQRAGIHQRPGPLDGSPLSDPEPTDLERL